MNNRYSKERYLADLKQFECIKETLKIPSKIDPSEGIDPNDMLKEFERDQLNPALINALAKADPEDILAFCKVAYEKTHDDPFSISNLLRICREVQAEQAAINA